MDKQTQVDGAVGSDGGGSRSVNLERIQIGDKVRCFMPPMGGASKVSDQGIVVAFYPQSNPIGVRLDSGSYWNFQWVKKAGASNTCPSCKREFRTPQGLGLHFHRGCPAQAPGLSNTEGTADQSDSTNQIVCPHCEKVREPQGGHQGC